MQHGAVGGRGFVSFLFFGLRFGGHGRILAYCGRGGREAEEEEISGLKFEMEERVKILGARPAYGAPATLFLR
jgi:hypothetical protein